MVALLLYEQEQHIMKQAVKHQMREAYPDYEICGQ
ncbi:predicted protein [Botrytis cinerea T4]|uniref:Uncharacterized protein n=1 Tax=Botryotinia fuckeliana (strain T4) TaxID=999810 RepID=G2Y3X0_BOTF4|nr:predicted protein [Botrytis cinerea T4]